jgi:leucyl-tRNA synthetase
VIRDGQGTEESARGADRYDFAAIEARWRARWEEEDLYRVVEDPSRPKFYALTMYPYPSGDLHIGHWYAMVPADARARYLRMRGYNVLFPMGFDAFGLPAENAAIKNGNIHPHTWTMRNIERMRGQLRSMGAMFDWSREVVTCDPGYYKWNQWFFLRFLEKGLAYRRRAPVDWCPSCNTTLAREQVVGEDRRCERCGTPVTRKELAQWFFRITAYAEELLDFSGLDWPERVITMQRNWIGRSEGVQFAFTVADRPEESFEVFTTRIDTVYGASFVVLAPEHPLVPRITTPAAQAAVEAYRAEAARRSEIERLSTERERTGVFTGSYARHPLTGAAIPIYIGDYVLASYGTGAIMAVPAHDARDFDFARRYGLPIPVVVAPPGWQEGTELTEAYEGEGILVHSGPFSGLPSREGWQRIADALTEQGIGRRTVQYRLRDWLISRQRYWGTPIPVVYCPTCGIVPVPDEELPVLLPMDAEFTPTGESPLLRNEAFRRTTCPRCGGEAERETDTMDTFVDSSWYQYRYLSPNDPDRPFDPEKGAYWLPVDQYTGGVEHATMHLLYTRFFTKAMRDLGLVPFDEPMLRLYNQGIILGENNERMSKSRGNVVAPDDLVHRYGADAVRVFLMFIGPWQQGGPWNPKGIEGTVRFLNRVWRYVRESAQANTAPSPALNQKLHETIRRVGRDLEAFGFNTAVAALMELLNAAQGEPCRAVAETFVLLLAPFAPFLAEELWHDLGGSGSVHLQAWPEYDPALAASDEVVVAVQVNGRLRDRLTVRRGTDAEELERLALLSPKVRAFVPGTPRKVVAVPDRVVNIVV